MCLLCGVWCRLCAVTLNSEGPGSGKVTPGALTTISDLIKFIMQLALYGWLSGGFNMRPTTKFITWIPRRTSGWFRSIQGIACPTWVDGAIDLSAFQLWQIKAGRIETEPFQLKSLPECDSQAQYWLINWMSSVSLPDIIYHPHTLNPRSSAARRVRKFQVRNKTYFFAMLTRKGNI